MAVIQFTDPMTAAIFETDFENDVLLEVGCQCNNGQGYKGYLSDVTPMAAQALVDCQSNVIRFKASVQTESKQSDS
jgi:hypothetical protein